MVPVSDSEQSDRPTDELFFWTRRWQDDEAESSAAREAGDVHEFASGRDAVRWLLSDDDEATGRIS